MQKHIDISQNWSSHNIVYTVGSLNVSCHGYITVGVLEFYGFYCNKLLFRPFSKQELEERSPSIIYIPSSKEVCVKHHFNEKFYQFDHVFGPEKKQEDVYYVVLEPVISEILDGFNCTVFTYGQTGTGKTYTVSGSQSSNQTSEIVRRTLISSFKLKFLEISVLIGLRSWFNNKSSD